MDKSPHLKLPFLAPSQAQKHVTVNESIEALDSITQCAVIAMHLNDPPAGAAEGDRYIVGGAPTGAWGREAGKLAFYANGGWAFVAPRPGWRVYDLASDTLMILSAAQAWTPLSGGGGGAPAPAAELQNATRVGIGATADAANPFTARVNSGLWTARTPAEGGDGHMYLKVNKSDPAKDAGYAFQSGFSTRALAGLFGSNRFRISVSPDGAAFLDALVVDDATGIVTQPQLPRFKASTNYDNLGAVDNWRKIGINTAEVNSHNVFDPAANRFTAPVTGTYFFGASILFKVNNTLNARIRGRFVVNGAAPVSGSTVENSGPHVSEATTVALQSLVALNAGDTVELQGASRTASCYLAANETTFWGHLIG